MAVERTLSIIKPDGVRKSLIGDCLSRFEKAGLKIIAARMMWMDKMTAENFYSVHRDKPFFESVIKFMTSGPCFVSVLEGENAILKNRELMGATDPKKATPGTIRHDFAGNIEQNVVHGSDSPETAAFEVGYFFRGSEVISS